MNIRELIIPFLKLILNPVNWFVFVKNALVNFPHTLKKIYSFVIFFIILIFFIIEKAYLLLTHIPLLGILFRKIQPLFRPITILARKITNALERIRPFQVRQSYLVEIAFGNLRARSNRTLITVFGMATGIGIIVYLLSLGYGIERLVVNQVASLDELRIVDVAASQNTALKIDRQTLKNIKAIPTVKDVIPLISLVGRVSFNKAQTDVLVYGADERFLQVSNLQLKKGKLFSDVGSVEDLIGDTGFKDTSGESVAGIDSRIQKGKYNSLRAPTSVPFSIIPDKPAPVWKDCDITSELLGYTNHLESTLLGKKMWGSTYAPYDPFGRTGYDDKLSEYLGSWLAAKVPLFALSDDGALTPRLTANGHQIWQIGCMQEAYVSYPETSAEDVLGTTSDGATNTKVADVLSASASAALDKALATQGMEASGSAVPAFETQVISTDSAGIEYVKFIASQEAQLKAKNSRIGFSGKPIAKTVISTGLMKLLNIPEKDVLEKTFTVSFIVSESLKPDVKGRQLSEQVTYSIVGLVEDDDLQYFYVPFSDMQKLGVQNFSQLKVLLKNEKGLTSVRTKIETYGYNTTSVVDTVSQIENLFSTLRLALGAIGLIALAVASLGMVNTLIVSLLERTREIGGMKVIGMVSEEIQDLFLAEAMIMGFSGGIGGLLIGYGFGHITSMLVSILSLSQGLGYLNLTYVPLPFTISILILSFVVGILTGLYPAKRARSISALNALRYE